MKTFYLRNILLLASIIIIHQESGFSQRIITPEEFNPPDSDKSGKLTSTYREFHKNRLYDLAMESWLILFNDFPANSEKLYVDGAMMYRHFIEQTPEEQARIAKVDSLMLIYDQRMAHFGGEGNVLGRKGSDLLKYRSEEQEQVEAAYGMLKESLEIQGSKSREPILCNYLAASLLLHQEGVIDKPQVLEDYFMVTGLLDQQEGSSSRLERTRVSLEERILEEDILSCEGLDLHFGPQLEQNSGDAALLQKIMDVYTPAGCIKSAVYTAASEKMYEANPSSELAHQLAMYFIGKNNLDKASFYLEQALLDEELSSETRAEWCYKLSVVYLGKGDHCDAISYARESTVHKDDYGKAYMALGDAFIACRKQLEDEFQQQCAYWAAADMYQAAARLDPSLAEESRQKLEICAAHYPSSEDIFFQDLQVGKSFELGGCIQEHTTVRAGE